MFKPILTRLLNHLVSQNSWAREGLLPFAGRAVCFRIPPASATIVVLEGGGLGMAGEKLVSEATVTVPLPVAARLLSGDKAAHMLVTIEGDTALASALAKVFRNIRWEYEEDLSRLIGDIPAYQLGEFGRKTILEAKHQALNVAQMFSEYWQEEAPLIAKRRHVEYFIKEVDTLREDTERLEKRLEKLSEKPSTPIKKRPRVLPKKKPVN